MDVKTCTRCGEAKPIGEFAKDRYKASGHKSACKMCDLTRVMVWEKSNPEKAAAKRSRFSASNPDRFKLQRGKLRAEVLSAYGSRCACCGETTPEFLTVDHINNDGAAHRKVIKSKLYEWLRANSFPKAGFQLLCFNCNCAKGIHGQCPHTRGVDQIAA